jgi:predicted glycosyltransferase involved in capsule biosynthesis
MIDLFYIFQFDKGKIEKAIERAKCSINSLQGQNVNILFFNFSTIDISENLKNLKIQYHHIPRQKEKRWNKSVLMNYIVKNHIRTLYFFYSDIDIVYPSNYIDRMLTLALEEKNRTNCHVRILPMVTWLDKELYDSDYNLLCDLKTKIQNTYGCGIGLFNTEFFKKIRGFDEDFSGWGHEDVHFNLRISKINTYIESNKIRVFHLHHARGDKETEHNIENKKKLDEKIKDIQLIRREEKISDRTLELIRSNIGFEWGNINKIENEISICIPSYEMSGRGLVYFKVLLDSIMQQTFKHYEIIVSDHSKNDDIKNYCKTILDYNIKYFRYEEKYGNGPANTNNAIKQATGKYIKIMFQDDCFIDKEALNILQTTIESSDNKWIVCSSEHMNEIGQRENDICTPRWDENGLNNLSVYLVDPFIGSPSRVMWLNRKNLFFDENLVHFMDVEMWFRLGIRFGHPLIYTDKNLVSTRRWPGSITNKYSCSNPIDKEIEYIKNKDYDRLCNQFKKVTILK